MDNHNNFTNYSTSSSMHNSDTSPDTNFEIINIKYIGYHDLPTFEENVKLIPLMRNISNPILEPSTTNWLDTFNAITDLRRVRKYYPKLFEHFFNILLNNLSEMLIQSNTPISRNILKLTSEIYSYHEYNDFFSDWMKKLLPKILIKSISEIKIVEIEAHEVLENLVQNVYHPESIEILLHNVNNKNINISNKSFEYLMKLLYNFDSYSFYNISECLDWERFLYTVLDLFENKKEVFITKAFKILDFLEEIFKNVDGASSCEGTDNFLRILSQIESLDFHARFDELFKGRAEFYNIKYRKRERYGNLKSTRHSIKTDKKRSVGGNFMNNFWKDGEIVDNFLDYNSDKFSSNFNNPEYSAKSLLRSIDFNQNQNCLMGGTTIPTIIKNHFNKENFACDNRGYFQN
jgi:hypothetical protein